MSRWVADGEDTQLVIEVATDGELTLESAPPGRSWTTTDVGQAQGLIDQLIVAVRLMQDRQVAS